jgi:FKBP-type peptidyl-prolyl cis-trans isomerase
MRKVYISLLTISLAGALFGTTVLAQQSSAPSSQQPAAQGSSTTAKKPSSATKSTASATAKKPATAPVVLATPKDKNSYAIGMSIGANIAKQMKQDAVEVDPSLVARGLKDAMAGDKTLMTEEEAKTQITTLSNDVKKHQQEMFQAAAEKNKKDGEEFLAANKGKPDVVTTPSGLEYKVIQAGDGPKPAPTDSVVCNYKGTLLDGTEFDSSAKHGQPITLTVNQVIKGWTEALQMMPVGSKWELYIPPSLAYGDRGTPNGPIGPNSTLIFDVELLSIQPKPQPKLLKPEDVQPQVPPPQGQPPPYGHPGSVVIGPEQPDNDCSWPAKRRGLGGNLEARP